ncbi:MAG: flagellar biosynthesis anti-sigma factor FlgM [Marinobacterium sp.]|nr:flagellar biosynthesis anti-sigma factor FlgM [Marinobacterium sp.]
MAIHLNSQIAGRAGPQQARADSSQASSGNDKNNSASHVSARSSQISTVSLSDTAQNLNNIQRKMADTPEIDQSKVERLKAAIDSGQYQIDSERIAVGMINMDSLID